MTRPRLIWKFGYQHWLKALVVHVDSNWARCRRTLKSTSGGSASWGIHTLKTWSKTQALVARSSCEAELYGTVRGACEGFGMQTLFKDLGVDVDVQISLDTNAAKGIVERKGLSQVRHLDTEHLWLQQEQARRLLRLAQIYGTLNPADLMTNDHAERDMCKHMVILHMELSKGRANIAADLHHVYGRRCGDSCDGRGKKGVWRRAHHTWRRSLFMPMKVPHGPGA